MHPAYLARQQLASLRGTGRVGAATVGSDLWGALALAGAATGIYHGYKRNNGSIGWGLGWGLFGSVAPVISIPLSLAEGFGKPQGT